MEIVILFFPFNNTVLITLLDPRPKHERTNATRSWHTKSRRLQRHGIRRTMLTVPSDWIPTPVAMVASVFTASLWLIPQ